MGVSSIITVGIVTEFDLNPDCISCHLKKPKEVSIMSDYTNTPESKFFNIIISILMLIGVLVAALGYISCCI